jgi:hypothetical protein
LSICGVLAGLHHSIPDLWLITSPRYPAVQLEFGEKAPNVEKKRLEIDDEAAKIWTYWHEGFCHLRIAILVRCRVKLAWAHTQQGGPDSRRRAWPIDLIE